MEFSWILELFVICNLHILLKCEVVKGPGKWNNKETKDQDLIQKLFSLDLKFEQKINRINAKFSALEKTVAQLSSQYGKGYANWGQAARPRVDCTVEDEKALLAKPVCDYDNCVEWSPWGSCDLETKQQSRSRLCHSQQAIKCPSKTETDTRNCETVCDFKNCLDWSPWTNCEITKLGENGEQLRKRTCWSNAETCNNKTETEIKICEPDCEMNQCKEWSDWTRCDIHDIKEYGTKKRSRKCGLDSNLCSSKTEAKTENCTSSCPHGYVITSYNSCLKLFYKRETWYDAEKVCQHDGGHLTYFDSRNKSDEVRDIFLYVWTGFWIDGIRNQSEAPWMIKRGSENMTFTLWSAGEPRGHGHRTGQGHAMCIYLDHQRWLWHSFNCLSTGHFMCEIKHNDEN